MKITIDAKNLDGPKPVISVKVEDDEPEVKTLATELDEKLEEGKDNRFIYQQRYINHCDGLTTATLELDTSDVAQLKEILRPYYFD